MLAAMSASVSERVSRALAEQSSGNFISEIDEVISNASVIKAEHATSLRQDARCTPWYAMCAGCASCDPYAHYAYYACDA